MSVAQGSLGRITITSLSLLFFTLFSSPILASGGEGEFNAGETILHHVKDEHSVNIGPLQIPLPVILMDDGVKVFPSSNFYSNEKEAHYLDHHGKKQTVHYYESDGYILFHEKIYKVGDGLKLDEHGHAKNEKVSMDFSITKNVAGIFMALILLILIFGSIAKAYRRKPGEAPSGLQNAVEPFILFIRDEVAKPSIAKNHERYVPFLLTMFFFIWISNILGLIPFLGGLNITGNIAVTMVLALFTFIISSAIANKAYWKHIIMPPVPIGLYPIMIPVEIIGLFSKPIVLMLRLFANITAGHIIILSFTCLIFIFSDKFGAGGGWGTTPVSVAFSVFMNILELLVALLQAYVFTLLSAIYFGMATEEAHH